MVTLPEKSAIKKQRVDSSLLLLRSWCPVAQPSRWYRFYRNASPYPSPWTLSRRA